MYIEQIRTYEIKKVAFKFNFLFLGYDIGREKKLKTLYDGRLVLLFLRLNFNVLSLVSGRIEILGNGNFMKGLLLHH